MSEFEAFIAGLIQAVIWGGAIGMLLGIPAAIWLIRKYG